MSLIDDPPALAKTDAHELALDCLSAAIDAARPDEATASTVERVGETLTIGETTYDLSTFGEIVVVGGGKATGGVASELESILDERIDDGLIVTKRPVETRTVRSAVGDHPYPSERNVRSTNELVDLLRAADSDALVLFVVTGGASALLTAPAGDLTVADLRETTELLLEGGVSIGDLNAVRKHLSRIKGGRAAREAAPATTVSVILSDVVGNDFSTIGSGPTVPDATTYADALDVFDRHDLSAPPRVRSHLEAGVDGRHPETPVAGDPAFDRTSAHLIGDNATALSAAKAVAGDRGYSPLVLSSRLGGDAREVGRFLQGIAAECATTGQPVEPPAVLLAGGEWTVTTTESPGQGGPNQELVLEMGRRMTAPFVVAAVDTDGEDGSSDVAGAIVDETTVTDPARALEFLESNDAGTFLAEVGATVRTGPTGTNVNDVVAIVVPERVVA